MPLTTALKNTMLGQVPNTVYFAVFNGGAPGTGTEVVPATLWGSGNRPAVALDAASAGARTPTGDVVMTVAVASQATTHIAAYDANTGGNLLGYEAFARTLVAGDQVKLADALEFFKLADS